MSYAPSYRHREWKMGTPQAIQLCVPSLRSRPQDLLGLCLSPTIPKGCWLATAPEPSVWERGGGSTRSSLGRVLADSFPPQLCFPQLCKAKSFHPEPGRKQQNQKT